MSSDIEKELAELHAFWNQIEQDFGLDEYAKKAIGEQCDAAYAKKTQPVKTQPQSKSNPEDFKVGDKVRFVSRKKNVHEAVILKVGKTKKDEWAAQIVVPDLGKTINIYLYQLEKVS